MWSPAVVAEAPAAVKETILECGQTTSVSMPSVMFVETAAGAGLLRRRAGTVNERRPLCSGVGAVSGVLEGASGEEDMVVAHAYISLPAVSCYVSLAEQKRRRSRRVGLLAVVLCAVGC